MGIGAIGAVSSTIYNPYVYNSNRVTSASLNKISSIPDDVTSEKLDYSLLVSNNTENVNPLKPGETKNFADVLLSQMSESALRRDDLLATNI